MTKAILLQKVITFLKNKQINTSSTFYIAVSGGVDSMTLLHIFHQLGFHTEALHCNFHLRGEESNRDQQLVESFCQQHQIKLHIAHFDTHTYAKQQCLSIEMAARELRYNWFSSYYDNPNSFLLVAHHAQDQLETVLINYTRGTGIKGLVGMRQKNGDILRPLLDCSQEEIISYANSNQVPFIVDSTNLTVDYTRNKIRHQVYPTLKEINPSILNTVSQNSRILEESYQLYQEMVQMKINKIVTHQAQLTEISIQALMNEPYRFTLLHTLLHPLSFSNTQIENILNTAQSEPGRQFLSPSHTLVLERGKWILYKTIEPLQAKSIESILQPFDWREKQLHFRIINREAVSDLRCPPQTAYFDLETITLPLTIRSWQQGDYFYPLGKSKIRKKLSDFMKDSKFTLFQKQTTPIILSNGEIIWIAGHRSDQRFAVTDSTKQILEITIK